MKKIILLGLAVISFSTLAADKLVKCEIKTSQETYKGECLFVPQKGGTFSLMNKNRGASLGKTDIQSVTVAIVGKDIAVVRGDQGGAINSAWGDAKRSPQEKACWIGADFRICAW